jgi:hypothetical protein
MKPLNRIVDHGIIGKISGVAHCKFHDIHGKL